MLKQFYKDLEYCEASVKKLSKSFCDHVGITVFAYVRIYDDNRAAWVTSNSDQDHFLLDANVLDHEPTFNTKAHVKEGAKLWFCDGSYPKEFYEERKKRFHMDHGLILVRHKKTYLETCYFSGSLEKRPLYNLFANEQPLFFAFMDHFVENLDGQLLTTLTDALPFSEFVKQPRVPEYQALDRDTLLALSGQGLLATISQREREYLTLFSQGFTHKDIG
ncbi:MAG: hypothetical protein LLF94_05745, partial [Chlamydiales bacterium]|nr:hypothetical protein [Chlamydiales bacterium]